MPPSLSSARRCLLAAKTTLGVTLGGVVSTEEAREARVGFMKELFFIFLSLSSDMVPPANGGNGKGNDQRQTSTFSVAVCARSLRLNDVCLCSAHTLSVMQARRHVSSS